MALTSATASATGSRVRIFYVGMALAALVTVFVGFSPTFYFRSSSQQPLAPLVVTHGVIFSLWVLLFVAQTGLVAGNRTEWHRRLGLLTAGLALVIVVMGPPIAIRAAARGALPGDPLAFLLVPLVDIVAFAISVGTALHYRHQAEVHKRFMLLGMASLLPPAISRWSIAVGRPPVILGALLIFLAAPVLYDVASRRPISRVSLLGGLALLASVPLRFALSQTESWHRVARWLTS